MYFPVSNLRLKKLKKESLACAPPPSSFGPLSLCPFTAITATGRPWQPQTLILSLRSSSLSSAVLKSYPSHKGKPLVHNGPWHDVCFCGWRTFGKQCRRRMQWKTNERGSALTLFCLPKWQIWLPMRRKSCFIKDLQEHFASF